MVPGGELVDSWETRLSSFLTLQSVSVIDGATSKRMEVS
jgi:hypothetical protein